MLTPFHPPDFTTLSTRTLSNAECREAVLERTVALHMELREAHVSWRLQEQCPRCCRKIAALLRLEALITGESVLWEDWIRAPRERVTA